MNRLALAAALVLTSACTATPPPAAPLASGGGVVAQPEAVAGLPSQPLVRAVAESAEPTRAADGAWLAGATGSAYVLVGDRDEFVSLWVDVPAAEARAHVPVALTLAIDTSGSMQGDKIKQAREAARTLVDQLDDGDIVAIHTFSDVARELVAPTPLDARSRMLIRGTLSELDADGATNLFAALELAESRAQRAPVTHPVRRVVIISDGRATAGPTSRDRLADLAERGTAHGVQVTSLGVGLDYDEDTLNALAVRSSGRLYHLADAAELTGIVRGELKLLQSTMATSAFVEVIAAPGVQVVGAGGVQTSWSARGSLLVPLGAMFAGQRRELLVRVRASAEPSETERPIVSARLHYNDPADGGIARVQEVVLRARLTTDQQLARAHQNPAAQAIVALYEAATVANNARTQVADGDFVRADRDLAEAETRLRQSADQAKDAREKKRIMTAAAELGRSRRAVQGAAAAPPSAKPAAARASALELNRAAMGAMGY